MKRTLRRLAGLGAASAVLAGLGLTAATTASAAAGYVIAPTSGANNVAWPIKTSAPCPSTATQAGVVIDGPTGSAWAGIAIVTPSPANLALLGPTGTGMPWGAGTLDGTAQNSSATIVTGDYTITVNCLQGAFTNVGTITGVIHVTAGTGSLGTGGSFTWTPPAAPASGTALAVSPASPQNAGTAVTLTATVTPSTAGLSTAGSVKFLDGSTVLATVATAAGTASTTTSALAVGTHSLTAVFTPTDPAVLAGSTSTPVSYVVNAAPVNTTLALASTPASPTTVDNVTLTATVGPSTATGSVTFTEGTTTLGTAPVVSGTATLAYQWSTTGAHAVSAAFTGTGVYLNSTASTTVTVAAYSGASTSQTVTTTIPAGTLTIAAAATPVNLGTATLNAANTRFLAGPVAMNPVTVTDTRAGSLGWTASGQVGDFTGGNATNKINGQNLGWTPKGFTGIAVTPGATVTPADGVAPGDTGALGLKSAHVLATAPAGASVGTAVLNADLSLVAPTTTKADTYAATLTLTAI